ncbi:hypothetical protein, partial [Archangium sp.]|uniref:hypothetical protein n=1 Tax=Archangium sp. TaxID=1872627 RepID=UPI00286BFFDA
MALLAPHVPRWARGHVQLPGCDLPAPSRTRLVGLLAGPLAAAALLLVPSGLHTVAGQGHRPAAAAAVAA